MDNKIKNILFADSYVLGWKLQGNIFRLYADLLLSDDHPKWKKFSKHEYGCYRLAIFSFYQTTAVSGLDAEFHRPYWNRDLGEYEDFSEFDSVEIETHTAVFELERNTLKIEFSAYELEILNAATFYEYERLI